MEEKNIQTVREYMVQVINNKHLDRVYEYCSAQCLFHSPPYVGLGLFPDDSSGERLVVINVAANAPAAGKVLKGDVLLRASDASGTWEGFEQLRTGLWGQGVLGTPVTLTLQRDGKTIDVALMRGRVEGFDSRLPDFLESWRHFLQEEMPDLHTEINQILAAGDRVAFYATNTGTNQLYHQSAVWCECNILRLENGKIVEWWGVEDALSQWRQFGYKIQAPA